MSGGPSKSQRMKKARAAVPEEAPQVLTGPTFPRRGKGKGSKGGPGPLLGTSQTPPAKALGRQKGKPRTPSQYAEDQKNVARLSLMGWNKTKISTHLDLGYDLVTQHMDNLQNYFLEVARVSVEERKGRQLALVDSLMETTVKGIEQAQLPTKRRTVEGKTGAQGKEGGSLGGKVVETTEPGKVDGSLIQAARSLMGHEADLLGMRTHPDIKVVLEERRNGKDLMLKVLKEEIKDPALLRRIADRLGTIGTDTESQAALTPCSKCGHSFDKDNLGKHGCPNCHGEGL